MTEIKKKTLIDSNFTIAPVTTIDNAGYVIQTFKLEDDKLFLVIYGNHKTKVYRINYLNKQVPVKISLMPEDVMLELDAHSAHTQSFAHFWRPDLFTWSEYHLLGCGPDSYKSKKNDWALGIGEWNPYQSHYDDSLYHVYYLTYFDHVVSNHEQVQRSEFSVSPDGTHFLLALNTYDDITKYHNLHLLVYNTDAIIYELSDCQRFRCPIDYSAKPENHYVYQIDGTDKDKFKLVDLSYNKSLSFQGFAIDNKKNIYISSEYYPKKIDAAPRNRMLIKISNDGRSLEHVDLNAESTFERGLPNNYLTEFEGIQADDENKVHLMVAYHDFTQNYKTVLNRLFTIKW